MPIGRRLLRLLGMFVQYGPSFREDLAFGKMGSSISPPRIALDEVAICVNEDFGGAGEQDVVLSERLFGYTGFNIYLSDVARSGLMFGKVKLLRASIKGLGNEIVWVVERRGEEAVRKKAIRWSEYGWVPGGFLKD